MSPNVTNSGVHHNTFKRSCIGFD